MLNVTFGRVQLQVLGLQSLTEDEGRRRLCFGIDPSREGSGRSASDFLSLSIGAEAEGESAQPPGRWWSHVAGEIQRP